MDSDVQAEQAEVARSIVGVFDSSAQAEAALEQLRAEGLGPNEVSIMMRDAHSEETVAEQAASSPVAGGAATGAALGGLLGGLAGWMVSIGALAIPGVGLVLGAGVLATMLTGIALGAATGGLIGALLSLGVPEDDARQYEGHLREGRILLTAHPGREFNVENAIRLMETNGGYDVRVYDSAPVRAVTPTGVDEVAETATTSEHFAHEDNAVETTETLELPTHEGEVAAHTDSLGSGAAGGYGDGEALSGASDSSLGEVNASTEHDMNRVLGPMTEQPPMENEQTAEPPESVEEDSGTKSE